MLINSGCCLDFSTALQYEQDNQYACDDCSGGDDYPLKGEATKNSRLFNPRSGDGPMPSDADWCTDVDPIVETLGGIGARQRQADATM